MKKYLGAFFVSIFLLGCNANVISEKLVSQLIEAPEVRAVSLKSFSVAHKSMVFDVSVYNPNIYPLPISGLTGDIQLNGVAIGSMAAKSDSMLAGHQTQVVTLPVQLNTSGFIVAAKKALSIQKATYSFNGGIETSAGTLPFATQGELSLTDIFQALLP